MEAQIPNCTLYIGIAAQCIGYACHSLTHCCLVNLIDVTLACEDANLKLVEVVSVADVDEEDHVGNSLLQIWELRLCHKDKFYSDLEFG